MKNNLAMSCKVPALRYDTTTPILEKAINHHINIVKLVLGGWQSDKKIHQDKLPGALWYRQEHVEICFMLVKFCDGVCTSKCIFQCWHKDLAVELLLQDSKRFLDTQMTHRTEKLCFPYDPLTLFSFRNPEISMAILACRYKPATRLPKKRFW